MNKKAKDNDKDEKRGFVFNIVVIVLTIILGIFAIRVVFAKIKGETYFLFNKYSVVLVVTESMEDTIKANSYILIEKVNASDIKVNDIITFKSEDPSIKDKLNTHRVIEITGSGNSLEFTTKGDNNLVQDSYGVPAKNLVARYVCNLTLLNSIGGLMTSGVGIIIIDVIIGLLAVFFIFRMFKKTPEEIEQDKEQKKQEEIDRLVAEEVERLKAQDKEKKE